MSSLGSHGKDGFRHKTLVSLLLFLLGDWEDRVTWLGGPGVFPPGWGSSGGRDVFLGKEGRGGLSEQGAPPWGLTPPSSSVPGLSQVKPLHSHSRYRSLWPCAPHVPPVYPPCAECSLPPSVFPTELLDSLSLFPVCLSVCLCELQSGCIFWNLAVSLHPACICVSPSAQAICCSLFVCLSLRWCMTRG